MLGEPVQVGQAVQSVQGVRAVWVAVNNLNILNDLNVWNMREQERYLRGAAVRLVKIQWTR
jgi:hypothetical protein